MLRNTIKTVGAIALIVGLTTCTTGPQKQKEIDGNYVGAMNGAPSSTITLRANNGVLTGTGNVKPGDPIYRTSTNEYDIIITGTYKSAQITSMSATISFEFNTTPRENETDTWIPASGEINFMGEFSKSGAASGGFTGITTISNVTLGGTWIVTQVTLGAGILKP